MRNYRKCDIAADKIWLNKGSGTRADLSNVKNLKNLIQARSTTRTAASFQKQSQSSK